MNVRDVSSPYPVSGPGFRRVRRPSAAQPVSARNGWPGSGSGRHWLLALLTVSLAMPAAGQDQPLSNDYVVSNWQTEQGLPENSATSIVHMPDGYLWFGTFRGLVRFDGHKFTIFDQRRIPALTDQGIVNLHRDRAGGMWISTLSGLTYGYEGSWTAFGPQQGWTGTYVRHFADAADGSVFLITFTQEIFRFADGKFARIPPPPGRQNPTFIFSNWRGTVRAVNRDFTSIWTLNGWESSPLPKEIGQGPLPAWADARDGLLWVLQGDTLLKLDGNHVTARIHLTQSVGELWSLTEDSSGLLWGAASRMGLYRILPDGEVNRYSTATGLPSNGVRFVYADPRGNRWIGTSGGGLLRIREKRVHSIGTGQGLPDFPVKAVAPAAGGRAFIATFGGGLFQFQDNRLTRLPVPNAGELYPQTLLVDRSGALWVGVFDHGLYQYRDGVIRQRLRPEDGYANIESLFEDGQGRIWISETHGRTASIHGESVAEYAAPLQHNGIPIRCVAQDKTSGAIWAGGDGGLFRFVEGEGFRPVTDDQGKTLPPLITIFPLDGQGIWIAPSTGGLLLWKDGKVVPVDSGQAPPAVVGGILGQGGNVWMATNRGLWRFRKSDLVEAASGGANPLEWQQFDRHDGLPSIECSLDHQPVLQLDENGRIWVATLKGAAVVDPRRLVLRSYPVPARVEEITYLTGDGVQHRMAVTEAQSVTIPPGSLDVHILYTAVDLTSQDKVRFSYTLSQDGAVVASGERSEREIVFARLPPGEYRFGLRVRNSDGLWNPNAIEMRLNLEPRVWEASWFRFCIIALSLIGVILIARYWARRSSQKQLRSLSREKVRAETEARLLQSTRMESIGRLAGGVAHDFNNLLTIVNGYSELLLAELPEGDDRRQKVENIHAAGQRAAELTQQLLSFSRSQAKDLVPLDLNAVVRDTAKLLQRMVGVTCHLELQLEDGIGPVMGDRPQLGQVLMNLVVNARDAMPDGGTVVIRTSRALVQAASSSTNPGLEPGPYAVLCVEDSGIGMDPETLRHAFEPFFTTKEPGKGTGMGLAIVYGVVKRAGGKIEVESEPGRGSRFVIYFPVVHAAVEEPRQNPEVVPTDTRRETILLVDDDAAVRRMMVGILHAQGYRVIEAAGGSEALSILEGLEQDPDLVISDILMPGMSGYELAERLAAQPAKLKLLFVSGYPGAAPEKPTAIQSSAPTLRKPFTSASLLAAVREAISNGGQSGGA